MKNILFFILLLNFAMTSAQDDFSNPKETIHTFFEAFHEQDTSKIRSLVFDDFKVKSIAVDKNGATEMTTKNFSSFLKSIKDLPSNVVFEERLLTFYVNRDGSLASIWTPYEFYINGELSHCGVNSFQLIKTENDWKIISIVDTRRKDNCQE